MSTIADIIRAGITAGKTNEAILKDVYKAFPQANTKDASVNWYRSKMRAASPKPKKTAAAEGVKELTDKLSASLKAKVDQRAKWKDEEAKRKAGWEDFQRAAGVKPDEVTAPPPAGEPTPAYGVKSIKTTEGMEGQGFTAKLYRGDRLIAAVADYGDGGPIHWDWTDVGVKVAVKCVDHEDEPHEYEGTAEEAHLWAHCLALPKGVNEYDKTKTPMHVTPDLFIEGLVNDVALRKQAARLLRGKIAIVEDGKLYTIKMEPTPANLAKVKKENPNAAVLNEMTEAAVLAVLRALQQ